MLIRQGNDRTWLVCDILYSSQALLSLTELKQYDVVEHSHYLKSKIQISYKKLLSRCQFKKLRLKSFKGHILASGVVQILWTIFLRKKWQFEYSWNNCSLLMNIRQYNTITRNIQIFVWMLFASFETKSEKESQIFFWTLLLKTNSYSLFTLRRETFLSPTWAKNGVH